LGEVIAVTAPMSGSMTWAAERRLWLAEHLGIKAVISTDQKHHVTGDVMIEDSANNLLRSPAKHKILFRRPWNERNIPDAIMSGCILAEDYYDVLKALVDIRNARTPLQVGAL
jgi:5'(3')-deoxyribonucleotidase